MSDIQERARFDFIRYANCWEDTDILLEALQIKKGARCISIASAGDNSLSMLTCDPASVVAVDLSRAQLACVELRVAAFRRLEYDDILRFLGFRYSDNRLETYRALRPDISEASLAFLDQNQDIIETGIIYAGKFEKYFKTFRTRILSLVHSRETIAELVADKGALEQEFFFRSKWNNLRWRALFRVFFSRFVMGKLGRDPEFFKYVEGSISDRVLARTEHALAHIPTYTNHYLNFIVTGRFPIHALPHYLRRCNFQRIRDRLDRLELFEGTLSEALRREGAGTFDAFNLSDIFEYISQEDYIQQLQEISDAASPGARIAFWNTFAERTIPPGSLFRADEALGEELLLKDKAFFYGKFNVGEKVAKK